MNYILEPTKKLYIAGNYDIAVVGGGIAGISAALAAARQGAKTVLIDRNFLLGGLATLGLVTIYLPLCDGQGRQVSFGIAEELLKLSIKHGYESYYPGSVCPDAWLKNGTKKEKEKQRYMVGFNPYVSAILFEQLLLQEGIELLYGTWLSSVDMNASRINALILENKSGRYAVKVRSVVDATGDADICAMSGAKTALFEQKNVLSGWYYYKDCNEMKLQTLGLSDMPAKYKSAEETKQNLPRYQGLNATELSQMTIDSHKILLEDFLNAGDLNEKHVLTSIPTIPQVRMTRRLIGEYTLDDTEDHIRFEDSIGMISDWRKSGPVYEIPFATLYSKSVKNLITAGRCISVTDAMWDISRVIPACAITGQAAGTAAALSDDLPKLDISVLQKHLKNNSVKLHIEEL